MESSWQQQRRNEAETLGLIGSVLAGADLPAVRVEIPRELAEQAVAAWEREDDDPTAPETSEERLQRHRAGTLALIGLSISERGRWEDDVVTVDLSPPLIGLAIDAADGAASE